jgi:AraC-like DNA-binding protein
MTATEVPTSAETATVWRTLEYRPGGILAGLVTGVGYEQRGFPAGEHHGLPSRSLTFVIPFEAPLELAGGPDGRPGDLAMDTCVGGLHTTPVMIRHDGTQVGIQLSLTPAGARSLLAVPAGELASVVVDATDLLGSLAVELTDRVRSAVTWGERFAILDEVLGRAATAAVDEPGPRPELEQAWTMITARRGASVARIAREVGWSRRHLSHRFTAEFGVGPKQLDRVVRFEWASGRLRDAHRPSLATVAAEGGYADQAHMARDWRQLAGCSPSEWVATEVLPFVQDAAVDVNAQ